MKSPGKRATIVIAVIACLAVLAGGWFLLVNPVKSDIAATKAKTAEQTSANSSAQLQLQVMRSISHKLPAERAQLAALSQSVPDQVELPAILRSMQSLAESSGVQLGSITPTQPVALTSAPGIATVGVGLTLSGGYAEVEQFESALEGLKRTFLVSSFTLTGGAAAAGSSTTAGSSSSGTGTAGSITANLTGRVLVHSSAIVTPAGTTPAAAPKPSSSATTGH